MEVSAPPAQVTAPAGRGPKSMVRRTQLLQDLARELPWFEFVIYRRGAEAPFVVDFGLGHMALTLAQVDMFVVGVRAANAYHIGQPRTLTQVTDLQPHPPAEH